MVKILLVDDHPLVRDGLKSRLTSRTDWQVCGEAEMPSEAMQLIRQTKPDIVIVDVSLKNGNGLELIKQIAAMDEPPQTLVCSMHDENLYAPRAVQAGARGFLHKQQASEQIVTAVQRLLDGKLFLSDEVISRVLVNAMKAPHEGVTNPIEQLTDRELQVFESIGRGLTIQQIADLLFLSSKTVETYRDRTRRKLQLRSAAELMHYAVKWITENAAG